MRAIIAALVVVAAGTVWPHPGTQTRPDWPLRVEPLPSPTGAGSAQPQLSVSSRGVLLSWIESKGSDATLKFAERTGDGWSAAKTIASGSDWFVNWADVPSVVRLSDGTLVAHWLQRSGPGTYAYDVRLSYSRDEGAAWAPSFTPHHDGTKTEHGFASLFELPGPAGGLGVVWLDGRQMTSGQGGTGHDSGDMSLRYASYSRDWKQTADTALDVRVCECCPTAAAMTPAGPLVAYRDRAEGEVRDILFTRLVRSRWTEPVPVFRDGWQFPACPVNGPSVGALGRSVALAWYQAKDNAPKAFVALSRDAGRTFSAPVRLDEGASLGRVDVEALADGSAAAAYIEVIGSRAEFRVKRVASGGAVSAPVTIAPLASNRSSGYPRMALSNGEFVFAWVDRDASGSAIVRTAAARLPPGAR
jgi:hypothetical protein